MNNKCIMLECRNCGKIFERKKWDINYCCPFCKSTENVYETINYIEEEQYNYYDSKNISTCKNCKYFYKVLASYSDSSSGLYVGHCSKKDMPTHEDCICSDFEI